MKFLLEFLFGCKHERTTWPLTKGKLTYVACLECGAEKLYDFQQMKEGIAIESSYVMAFFRGYSVKHGNTKLTTPLTGLSNLRGATEASTEL